MEYTKPPEQSLQSTDLRDYKHRIIVAGTRHYKDKIEFHNELLLYLKEFDTPVIFISGAAWSGADRFIIDWCKKYHYPCHEEPADWDNLGNSAGYIRNAKMAELGTDLLCFYDGKSNGTKHMIDLASDHHLPTRIINITL